ncbi:MAG: glycosyltransferase family A protein [Candidatus Micrarchaeaceae archaeon]
MRFHVLIATIGRKSIFYMLNSLKDELSNDDFLTIVYDDKDIDNTKYKVKEYIKKFKCKTNIIWQSPNLGYFGHAIRQKYKDLEGDFILHADDDNLYFPGSFTKLREICVNKNTLYLFSMLNIVIYNIRNYELTKEKFKRKLDSNFNVLRTLNEFIYKKDFIPEYRIQPTSWFDTGIGVIPAYLNKLGTWGLYAGGDVTFYESVIEKTKNIEFIDICIYLYTDTLK